MKSHEIPSSQGCKFHQIPISKGSSHDDFPGRAAGTLEICAGGAPWAQGGVKGDVKKTRCVSERLFSRWKTVVLRTVMVWDQETWFSFMGLKECPKPAIPPPRTEVRSPWDGLMEVKSSELPSRPEPHIIEALKPFKTSRLSDSDWVQGKISINPQG